MIYDISYTGDSNIFSLLNKKNVVRLKTAEYETQLVMLSIKKIRYQI